MKLRTALFFGIGYLLGAKAGRDRYEQLRRLYLRTASNDHVRRMIDQGRDLIDTGTIQAREVVAQQLSQAGDIIRQRAGSTDPG
ncbi:MAG: hypothetical protein WBV06_12640 [Acidimicrobiia bacterium]|jgi:hypothetical protein